MATSPQVIASQSQIQSQSQSQSQSSIPDAQSKFCLAGCPTGASQKDKLVVHHIYELDNNPQTKFADWVAYKISIETLGSGCKRIWQRDPDLSSDVTLSPEDYRGARKALASDRGHQAPLASLCGSSYWQEADYLSNITPQQSTLNEGTWERLENAERKLVTDQNTDIVYSVTGPLYEHAMPALPQSHLEAITPSGYWKVVSFKKGSDIYASAFIMDQMLPKESNFCDTAVTLTELEARTHLHFFPNIDVPHPMTNIFHQDVVISDVGCK